MPNRFLVLAAAAALFGSSCQRNSKKTIAVIPKATSHLFFMSVHAGVRAAEKEFGVNVLWNGPENETDYSRQIEITDAMVARHVDALAISATDQTALVTPVKRAIDSGIPVTIFDSGLAVDNYVTFVATDNYDAGRTAARQLAALINGKGKIAMILQKPGGQSTGIREKGFEEAIAREFPDIKIVARQFGLGDPAKSRSAAENILTAHPNLDGMFASAEASSIGAVQAISSRNLSGKIKLVGFDFSDTHREALKNGTMAATIVQDPYQMGYQAVRTLALKLRGETPPKQIDLKGRVVTKEDLSKPELQALLSPVGK
ncbi:MAG TPA: substrate-binding domain-containing protein [Bryobacteraceae bacterium]|nr:substrate-binding domain-containing protein [Bryobacteraceae bacterium]